MIELKVASIDDIEDTIKLHQQNQVDLMDEEDRADGFITTAFTRDELKDLIEKEQGLFIAKDGDKVVGYVMSASWQYWSTWSMFAYMIEHLGENEYLGEKLSVDNSYQYGPVCVDKNYRGSGLFEKLFEFALSHMSKRYAILVTFINKINTRSYEAHTRKLALDVVCEFEYNSNQYYELCYDTSKGLK